MGGSLPLFAIVIGLLICSINLFRSDYYQINRPVICSGSDLLNPAAREAVISFHLFIVYLFINVLMFNALPSFSKHRLLLNNDQLRRDQVVHLVRSMGREHQRSHRQIAGLMALLKEEPFFCEFSKDEKGMFKICQKIDCVTYQASQTIYSIRKLASCFYIIMKGRVHLTLPEEVEPPPPEPSEADGNASVQKPHNLLLSALEQIRPSLVVNLKKIELQINAEEVKFVDRTVRVVQSGECFGEMMKDVSFRATNAVAAEDCQILVIDKQTYETLVKSQLRTDNKSRYTFLSTLDIFKCVTNFALQRLCLLAQLRPFSYGQMLFNYGEPIDKIFIVRDGEFKIMKRIHKQYTEGTEHRSREKSEYKLRSYPMKQVPFRIIHSGQIIGDCEMLQEQSNYEQICLCQTQQASVLQFDKRKFFKILRQNQSSFEAVRDIIQHKISLRNETTALFLSKRTHRTYLNGFLNEKSQEKTRRQITERDDTEWDTIGISKIYKDEQLMLYSTTGNFKPSQRRRFSVKNERSKTEKSDDWKFQSLSVQDRKREMKTPSRVRDVVDLMKIKSVYHKKMKKSKRVSMNIFQFDPRDVPVFIRQKYGRM